VAVATLTAASNASATVINFGSDYFEYISNPGISWADAKTAADAMTYLGATGYLAAITSAPENAFLATNFSTNSEGFAGAWLGGEVTAAGAGFWEDGPLTGVQFSQGQASVGGNYVNWGGIEPNNPPSAVYMNIGGAFSGIAHGQWVDAKDGVTYEGVDPVQGYIVEYSGVAVPEPSTWAMLILGVGAIGAGLRRYAKRPARPSLLGALG
jgi:hypothetical protein